MSSNHMDKEDENADKSVPAPPISPYKGTYARRTASLNAEAALKCLTEASRRMSPSTRAYYSRKRNSQGDAEDILDVGKLTPRSTCTDSSAIRSLQFSAQDSASTTRKPQQRKVKSKQQYGDVKTKSIITKTITVPQDLFVRRTANLNASACMAALLSPTKKVKMGESGGDQNFAVIVPAQEDIEVDVVDVDPTVIEPCKALKAEIDRKKVKPKVNDEVTTISNAVPKTKPAAVQRPSSLHKASDPPQVPSPIMHKASPTVPDKTLLVPMRHETLRDLVEEGLQLVKKTTQKKPSKLSRRENNGWSWIGKPIETVTSDKGAIRKYYIGMRRKSEAVFVRDTATFWSGESDVPYVGKILSFWQEKNEMMCSVYWYYQLEDENLLKDELLASQHVDHNPVAAIIEKCYVLGLSEYCRYKAMMKCAINDLASTRKTKQFVWKANQSLYECLRTPDSSIDPSLVYLCQKSYNYKTGKITGRK